ncbi:hypothetical protein SAMN05444673_4055 [Bacillus sp. OV166]|uniref:membrane lipoprotein lipid attachment site-containing protein n=1 Tax=Bacillus sp. OV166 TaxID=1882763 RepID=UPI000A2AE3EE|nr:membrane lipoprotein lipid attachment site-containing protein [Bacillus sp. OV166]SMQ80952.1 hypothetical protein SAMN05444673_4055 [Bacillus sp. OV166]
MKKFTFFILIVLFLSGCTGTTSQSENLIQKLQEEDHTVIEMGVGNSSGPRLFSVNATYYKVDGKPLAIYEFPNEKEAKKESKTISEDGTRIGRVIVEPIDIPHFYQKGEIIVSYIGSDTKLEKDLENVLGKSITNSPILNK